MSESATPSVQPSDAQISQQSREFLHDIYIDDVTQKMAVGRAVFAAGYGIDPRPYSRPFPGSTSSVTMASQTPKTSNGKSGIINAGLAALGGAGAMGLIAAAVTGFGGLTKPAAPSQATIEPVEYSVIFDGVDGLKVEQESGSQTQGTSP